MSARQMTQRGLPKKAMSDSGMVDSGRNEALASGTSEVVQSPEDGEATSKSGTRDRKKQKNIPSADGNVESIS